MCCGCIKVVVYRKIRRLLNNKILNYFVKCPHLHILRLLHKEILVDQSLGIVATPLVLYLTFRF